MPFVTHLAFAESTIPWKTNSYTTIARSQSIHDALRTFAGNEHINIVIDPSVQGVLSGQFLNWTPQKFFDNIVQSYDLIWFYDGQILYVTVGTQITSAIVQLSSTTPEQLVSVFNTMKFASSDWSIRSLPDEDLIFFSGPPRFVELMSQLAGQLDQANSKKAAGEEIVRVFPLVYAWAHDVTYTYGDNSIQVAGVANIVAALMQGKVPAGLETKNTKPESHPVKAGMNQSFPSVTQPSVILHEDREDQASPMYAPKKNPEIPVSPGNIIPDARTNSIIVKDVKNKMPMYESLIKQLDSPTPVIEITAAIVDVSKGSGYDVGPQLFNGTTPEGNQIAVSTGTLFNTTETPGANSTTITFQGSIKGFQFWNAIRALENKNKAKVLARPSILTLDNTQAVIDRTSKKYISVSSERQANLFDATVGLTMKVTPHFINRPDETNNQIKLLVNIEDGSFEAESTNAIPTASTQNSINTQAIIDEGESLLIGGHYAVTETSTRTGVPILQRIPLLGIAFREDTKTKQCIERLYLITPRIVDSLAAKPAYKKVYTSTENFTAPAFTDPCQAGRGEACTDITYLGDNLGGEALVCELKHATCEAGRGVEKCATGACCLLNDAGSSVEDYACKMEDGFPVRSKCCEQPCEPCYPFECDRPASCPDRNPCSPKGMTWSAPTSNKSKLLSVNDLMAPNANTCYVNDSTTVRGEGNICCFRPEYTPCSASDETFTYTDGEEKRGRVICKGDRCSKIATQPEEVSCPKPNDSSRRPMRTLQDQQKEPYTAPCSPATRPQPSRSMVNEAQQASCGGTCTDRSAPQERVIKECPSASCSAPSKPQPSSNKPAPCNSWDDWFTRCN